jgi:hypothetical protein
MKLSQFQNSSGPEIFSSSSCALARGCFRPQILPRPIFEHALTMCGFPTPRNSFSRSSIPPNVANTYTSRWYSLRGLTRTTEHLADCRQVRYAATEIDSAKSARARGSYLRVSFKNTRETAQAINGWKLQRALTYLENVQSKSEAVPMRRYAGSTGRTAQGT